METVNAYRPLRPQEIVRESLFSKILWMTIVVAAGLTFLFVAGHAMWHQAQVLV